MEMMRFFKNVDRIAAQELGKAGEEGERAVLTRLLTRRFGELPVELTERIERARTSQFERWSVRVLDAHSLDEVFGRAARVAGSKGSDHKEPAQPAC